jgi:hypothetical protein
LRQHLEKRHGYAACRHCLLLADADAAQRPPLLDADTLAVHLVDVGWARCRDCRVQMPRADAVTHECGGAAPAAPKKRERAPEPDADADEPEPKRAARELPREEPAPPPPPEAADAEAEALLQEQRDALAGLERRARAKAAQLQQDLEHMVALAAMARASQQLVRMVQQRVLHSSELRED